LGQTPSCRDTPILSCGREAEANAPRGGEAAAFVKDWDGKHADRIAAHFAGDGNVMVPNGPTMTGKDTIGKTMKDALADPNRSLAVQSVQVDVSKARDLGYTRGTYVLTATDPASEKMATEKGRFVTIFRKDANGSWKAVQQISNAEAPATIK
jgi:ketosteroid isomerase-like protein